MNFKIVLFLLAFSLISSCDTGFDVNAPWKETMIVYSLLDASTTTHYVKVNKAFLNGNNDVYTIAKGNPDSSQYPDILDVALEQLDADQKVVDTIKFSRTKLLDKQTGIFSDSDQFIYIVENVILRPEYTYRLYIINRESGKKIEATTVIVDELCFRSPGPIPYSTNQNCGPSGKIDSMSFNLDFKVDFHTAKNASVYELFIEFTYAEFLDKDFIGNKTLKWQLIHPTHKEYNPRASTFEGFIITKNSFFDYLYGSIDTDNDPINMRRKFVDLSFNIYAASSEFELYRSVMNSNVVLSQSKPEYTNIKGGLGLLASRNKRIVEVGAFSGGTWKVLRENYSNLKFVDF